MKKPLEGIRVLDFSHIYAAPFCSMLMADLGADVVKLERPEGEENRNSAPLAKDGGWGIPFNAHNRNKRGITLNLQPAKGKEVFAKLLRQFDILVENYRPGVLGKLGFPYERVREINPAMIMVSISGFGQTGPYSQRAAHDQVLQAMSGMMHMTGDPEGSPYVVNIPLGDYTTALWSTISVLAAIRLRDFTGEGQHIDVGMLEALVAVMPVVTGQVWANGEDVMRFGNGNAFSYPTGLLKARDGYLYITAGHNRQWANVCRAIEREDLITDPRMATRGSRSDNRDFIRPILEDWVAQRTVAEAVKQLDDNGVPCGPLLTPKQVVADPHIVARGMFADMTDKRGKKRPVVKFPVKFSGMPGTEPTPPPDLGEHNEEIYCGMLGYSKDELAQMKADGVI